MATEATNTDTTPDSHATVTEVWPDRFELTFESGGGPLASTTTYALDRSQLRALRRHINDALH